MAGERVQRRLAAILAADVVGYSRMMQADEAGTLAALKARRTDILQPLVARHCGRVIKLMGDGVLIEYASAVDAVACAVDLQDAMAAANAEVAEERQVVLRIGINLGDVIVEGGDLYGDGVNIAARLEELAPAGGVLVSDAVHAQVKGKVAATFLDAGSLSLKNIEMPVRVWRWGGGGSSTPTRAKVPADTAHDPSVAVLPFSNMSGDPDQDFFADGLVEDIITTLSKLTGLRVIARNSSFVFRGQAIDVRDVARQLGVRFVLEGSVRKSGNRVRITAQLIDATSGSHVWAERYDRAFDDIFAVQDEITLVLATELQVKLTEGEQARLHYTTTSNVEAWTYWVRGLSHYRQAVTKENASQALACWQKALALDTKSAALNGMLGFLHYVDARFGWWDDRATACAKARSYTERALELDPANPDANTASSLVMLLGGRHDDAAAHARRAAQLAPGSADAATFACFVLAFAGYPLEAAAHGERAMTLSPNYPGYYLGHLGNAYRLAGRYEEAIAAFTSYNARTPGFGLADLVIAYHQIGRPEEAQAAGRQLLAVRRNFTVAAWADTQFFRSDRVQLEADVAALRAARLP